jgi:hypothetical protein
MAFDTSSNVVLTSAVDDGQMVFILSGDMYEGDTITGAGCVVLQNSADYTLTFENISGLVANNISYV